MIYGEDDNDDEVYCGNIEELGYEVEEEENEVEEVENDGDNDSEEGSVGDMMSLQQADINLSTQYTVIAFSKQAVQKSASDCVCIGIVGQIRKCNSLTLSGNLIFNCVVSTLFSYIF